MQLTWHLIALATRFDAHAPDADAPRHSLLALAASACLCVRPEPASRMLMPLRTALSSVSTQQGVASRDGAASMRVAVEMLEALAALARSAKAEEGAEAGRAPPLERVPRPHLAFQSFAPPGVLGPDSRPLQLHL